MLEALCIAAVGIGVAVAALVYLLAARDMSSQNLPMHSRSEPLLGITRLLMGTTLKPDSGIMMWHLIIDELKRNGWRAYGWSAIGGTQVVQIVDPKDIKYVTKDNWGNFNTSKEMADVFRHVLGPCSLFLSHGQEWRMKRAAISHMFTMRVQRERMSDVLGSKSQTLARVLLQRGSSGEAFDVQSVLSYFTFDTTNSVVFSRDMQSLTGNPEHVDFATTLDRVGKQLVRRFLNGPLWKLDCALQLSAGERQLSKDIPKLNAILDDIVSDYVNPDDTINERAMRDGTMSGLLFEHMPLEDMPDPRAELRSFMLTMLAGGRDSSASALTCCIEDLCRHPEWQDRLHEEALQVFGAELDRPLTLDDIQGRCPVTEAVFSESLRLSTPIVMSMRDVVADATLPTGATVREGQKVFWSQYTVHRNPSVWGEDAEEFRPERFMNGKKYADFDHVTFGSGPRGCPGYAMGKLAGHLALLTVFSRCRVRYVDGFVRKDGHGLAVTHAAPGMMVHVTPRGTAAP